MVVWHGAHRARRLVREHCRARHLSTYATTPQDDANVSLRSFTSSPEGLLFEPEMDGVSLGGMQVRLWGELSACNALAALCAVSEAGLSAEALRQGFATFKGVRRRMEVRGEPFGVCVVDDFAHHPTAVRLTLEAARSRWPHRRLVAVFEPRSATSRRNFFQNEYIEAFLLADQVFIGSHVRLAEIAVAERFDPHKLAAQISARGVPAQCMAEPQDLAAALVRIAQPGDVLMILSNGDFGGLHTLVLDGLQRRGKGANR